MKVAKIILDRRIVFPRAYCWRDDWVSRFESSYSLLSKFAFLNSLTGRDVALLVLNQARRERVERQMGYETNLIAYENFDFEAFGCLLRISTEQVEDAFGQAKNVKINFDLKAPLRFCPICARSGFHATIFQHNEVVECPIHHKSILDCCPRCNRRIPYMLSHATFKEPYCCPNCQFDLAVELRTAFKRTLSLTGSSEADLQAVKKLLILKETHIRLAPNALETQFPGVFPEGELSNATKLALFKEAVVARLGESFDRPIPSPFEKIVEYRHLPDENAGSEVFRETKRRFGNSPQWPGPWYDWDTKLWELYSIYQAIRRHIWRRTVKDHQRCVVKIAGHIWWRNTQELTPPMCGLANAFVQWRMRWEGCSIPRQLLGKPDHAPLGLVTWLSGLAPECPENWQHSSKRWLIHRIFLIECHASFNALVHDRMKNENTSTHYDWPLQNDAIRHSRLWAVGGGSDFVCPIRLFVSSLEWDFTPAQLTPVNAGHFQKVSEQLKTLER